ncbi:DNA-binding protein [Spirochaetia bacterium]|nr:DNA-binding protein [Spirochaetia bacterium]
MRVFFDTNVIVDIIEQRELFFKHSSAVFLMAVNGQIEGLIGAGSITDLYYITRRSLKDATLALNSIIDILKSLTLVDTTAQSIWEAMGLNFADFEDAVITVSAQREKVDYIITRNAKDFGTSPIPAISPDDFLNMMATLR